VAHGNEDDQERRNRQLDQLLQETRVVMPGVQVLFAFLLAVVFQQGFEQTTTFQKDVFLATILASTGAAVCFIAPAAWHRILFEQQDKRHIIRVANRFVICGVGFLSLAMTLALILVCDVVFVSTTATIVGAVAGVSFAWFWFAAPLLRRHRDRDRARSES
jgi:predicted membrane channel-forming protein YqfA (hemolysin III family)